MKVLKFGGTSVGSVDGLNHVKQIVEGNAGEQVIVVVSALSGVTDLLQEMARRASKADDSYELLLDQVLERHNAIIASVVPTERQAQCRAVVSQFVNSGLSPFLQMLSVNRQLDPAMREGFEGAIVAHGEILSSAIVASMISGAVPHFAPNFIKTRDTQGERILDPATFDLIAKEFNGRHEPVQVTQGFIAEDSETGAKTNLGRGGSDFTAALIAAALNARCLEIWTDVDGFYTADPRKHPDAQLYPRMTYEQALLLCQAGAKVIYAPTLSPVALKHIPVWVKNTFNPTAPGTVISDQAFSGVKK